MRWISRCLSGVLILHFLAVGISIAEEKIGNLPKRHTLKELRDQQIIKQQYDNSCGAAVLATIMTYYFKDKTSEREIYTILAARLNQLTEEELVRKKRIGFSLLDLKYAAQQKGYKAAGFKLTIDQLSQLAVPVIVFVQPRGFPHFSVLRGVVGDRVFLADPARGNLRMSIGRFLNEWDGIVFVLGKPGEEDITSYPLALGRPGDSTPLQPRHEIGPMANHFKGGTDLAVRLQPR